jgi:F1F0 ATPase subunit 2
VTTSMAFFFTAGLVIGAVSFGGIAINTRLHIDARPRAAIAVHVLRIAVAAGAFALIAGNGPAPLLVAFAGFMAVRIGTAPAVPSRRSDR